MIKKSVRWLLLCLVAVAVPVQGVAATGAGVCMGLGHHDGLGAVMHALGVGQQDEDPHVAGDAHSPAAENLADDDLCAPCGASCTASAVSAIANLLSAVLPSSVAVAFEGTAPPDFFAELPDRPPLELLA